MAEQAPGVTGGEPQPGVALKCQKRLRGRFTRDARDQEARALGRHQLAQRVTDTIQGSEGTPGTQGDATLSVTFWGSL